jgi:hypothetical protein
MESNWNLYRIPAACGYDAPMADESDGKAPETTKKSCTLSVLTLRRLERLARRATHGPTASAVMTYFIEAGVRDAIERGYIRLEDDR